MRDQLGLVARYLELQRVRFGDRLRIKVQSAPDASGWAAGAGPGTGLRNLRSRRDAEFGP